MYAANGNGSGNGRGSGNGTTSISAQLAERLRHLGEAIPPSEIAELWIFPPMVELENSSEFFIFTRFFNGKGRRVYSAGLSGIAEGEPIAVDDQEILEHGSVPHDRIPRLVERFQRRLGENREPRHLIIEGCEERWATLFPDEGSSGELVSGAVTIIAAEN